MNRKTALKIIAIQELAMKNPDYLTLLKEYRALNPKLQELLSRLPYNDQTLLSDYLGTAIELHIWLLGYACEQDFQ